MTTVHFVGICGTAMATLAGDAQGPRLHGQRVGPARVSAVSDFLAAREIPCQDGFDADHITDDVDLVVIGNAVSRGNPEVEAVLDRKLRYRSLPEMVRETFSGTGGRSSSPVRTGRRPPRRW